jgi:flagellar biosynthetic protein FliO
MPVLLQVAERTPLPGGYGVALLQTLLALAAVCIFAWVLLRWGARRGLGLAGTGGAVRVVERVVLDPRRMLYVVRVGDRLLLLGAGDGAAPTLLTELDPRTVPEATAPRHAAALFREALSRAQRVAPRTGTSTSGPAKCVASTGGTAAASVPAVGSDGTPPEFDDPRSGGSAGGRRDARGRVNPPDGGQREDSGEVS